MALTAQQPPEEDTDLKRLDVHVAGDASQEAAVDDPMFAAVEAVAALVLGPCPFLRFADGFRGIGGSSRSKEGREPHRF